MNLTEEQVELIDQLIEAKLSMSLFASYVVGMENNTTPDNAHKLMELQSRIEEVKRELRGI